MTRWLAILWIFDLCLASTVVNMEELLQAPIMDVSQKTPQRPSTELASVYERIHKEIEQTEDLLARGQKGLIATVPMGEKRTVKIGKKGTLVFQRHGYDRVDLAEGLTEERLAFRVELHRNTPLSKVDTEKPPERKKLRRAPRRSKAPVPLIAADDPLEGRDEHPLGDREIKEEHPLESKDEHPVGGREIKEEYEKSDRASPTGPHDPFVYYFVYEFTIRHTEDGPPTATWNMYTEAFVVTYGLLVE